MISKTVIPLLLLALVGCAPTVKMINGGQVNPSVTNCNPTIYDTLRQAEKKGQIEELCVIKDDSGMSLSISGIKESSKKFICQCGATDAYIQSSSGDGILTSATATIIGFKYLATPTAASGTAIDRSKQCQSKGGLLVNGICQIPLE